MLVQLRLNDYLVGKNKMRYLELTPMKLPIEFEGMDSDEIVEVLGGFLHDAIGDQYHELDDSQANPEESKSYQRAIENRYEHAIALLGLLQLGIKVENREE